MRLPILSPTDFLALTNQILDTSFGYIFLQGEVSEFKISKNQWVRFKLTDEYSKVACFGTVYNLPGPIEDGMIVKVAGTPKLHPQFGFSITFQNITAVGEGSIHQALALLKAKLQKEGLLDLANKRALPSIPQKIALVTSIESAAYADFIKITKARWPFVEIVVYDSLVQGENAPGQLVKQITNENSSADGAEAFVIFIKSA
jgi:exodeoxyribonuclease VII large subunit